MSDDETRLDATETRSTERPSAPSAEGQQVGPYRLCQRLGEGGMGEVWEAEQTEPVRRTVALKLIKPGMDTKQVLARFEAERQALAMMDHPAIARVYDAGATPQGRPYFAMEHVHGVPLTEHCDRQKLTNHERLELFMQVCEGVQHAHQKAVIHRDLKPSNVLVSLQEGKAVPKIIDFGVAKATARKLTDRTMHTQLGVMIGTPAYMSPEQAEMTGQDIDTRTDVYALGVMLYELLVGALPFDAEEFRRCGLEEVVRKIREDEPPKPSTRLSTRGEHSTESALRRRTALPVLKRELSGDLDWITMKALEKDRTRRYGSPQELAADIARHLRHEPVLASPPSTAYRAGKFVKRHTWGVAAAAVSVLVLFAFAATMAVQSKRISVERDLARRAQADLEAVAGFQARMLSATDPERMGQRLMETLARRVAETYSTPAAFDAMVAGVNSTDLALDLVDEEILARAVETLEEEFREQPLIDARLRHTIGDTYRKLGRYERAEPQLAEALEIRKRVLGDDHPDTLHSMNVLAILYKNQGRYDDAEPLYVETLGTRKRVLGGDHPHTLASMNNLANLYDSQGRYDEAEALDLEALGTRKRVLGDEHRDTLGSMNNLAILYKKQGRYDEAERLYLEALRTRKRVLGDDHPETLTSMNNLAILYRMQGHYEKAEGLYSQALETSKSTLGHDHPDTLRYMNGMAELFRNQGRYDEAEPLYLETLETRERVLGDEHPITAVSIHNLGCLYRDQGRHDEAQRFFERAQRIWEEQLGSDHPYVMENLEQWAALLRKVGDAVGAERLEARAGRIRGE